MWPNPVSPCLRTDLYLAPIALEGVTDQVTAPADLPGGPWEFIFT